MNPHFSADAIPVKPEHQFRLWIPWVLVWFLLLPFILLLAPCVFVACLVYKVNAFRGVAVYWRIFDSLRGLRVEVEDPGARIRIL